MVIQFKSLTNDWLLTNIQTKRGAFGLQVLMLMVVLLVGGMLPSHAQTTCFVYEDSYNTVISGLTESGLAATTLTIPKEVNTVKSGAFSSASARVSALVIEDGGNPTFESGLFGYRENPLTEIQILGSSMTAANISTLFTSLGSQGALSTIYIAGYSGEWTDITESSVLTSAVNVTLPAAKVSTQQFGAARVYGRFEMTKELITFCGNATFRDSDDGSNMLFYVADACNKDEGYVHIQRVSYVAKGQGVLIHNAKSTSTTADLLRVSEGSVSSADNTLYGKNMFVGVTVATSIAKTDGDKTNLVLSNGAFHPTSGGTIGANKAYLQVPTDVLAARGMLAIRFDDEETGISIPTPGTSLNGGEWYDLQGRKFDAEPAKRGVYINHGKKIWKK